jgi:RHS repeat-associated protein
MKKAFTVFVIAVAGLLQSVAQTCSTCGGPGGVNSQGKDIGPSLQISLGAAQYGQSAGHLIFSSSVPNGLLYTPAALQFTGSTRPDVTVVTTNLPFTNVVAVTNVFATVTIVTNTTYMTNVTSLGTNIETNISYDQNIVVSTNTAATNIVVNSAIRQVIAPQMLADIPVPPTGNGYVINFYFASQVGSVNPDGTYAVSGTPFVTWTITNTAPSTINQIRISQTDNVFGYGLMKQWDYTYTPGTGSWAVQDLGGIKENTVINNLTTNTYQVSNSWQYASGSVVQQTTITYTNNTNWGVAPLEVDVGSGSATQKTTYSYDSSGLLLNVTHADGSWEYYASRDTNGNPLTIYSTYNDVALGSYSSGRLTTYTYDPSSAVPGSGDDGSVNPTVPRLTSVSVGGHEISRSFTVFPSAYERLDIQCATSNAVWNASDNLVTASWFYTNGANQFALQKVIKPDQTMITYDYVTNSVGTYRTNLTAIGVPDGSFSYIVDGTSNWTVLNSAGYTVYSVSYDVASGIMLSQDTYTNFDDFSRPQQVVHLDGTTNVTQYACCGLDFTTDSDGVQTQYLYDPSKRQIGYHKIYNGSAIAYTNALDAAGRVLQSIRVGTDSTPITTSQSQYDLAGEVISQTNALNGPTARSRTHDGTTGGLIIATVNPDGGTSTSYYYADGALKTVTGTAVPGMSYAYGVDADGGTFHAYTLEVKVAAGGGTNEWTKSYVDMLGRPIKTVYAAASGTPTATSAYNNLGQLIKQVDPDGVTNLYQYNPKGEQSYVIQDINGNGIDWSGPDRITFTMNDVTNNDTVSGSGVNVRRTRTYQWNANSNSSNLVSTVDVSTDGLRRWIAVWNNSAAVANTSQTAYSGTTNRSVTSTAPDGSYTVSAYQCGRLISVTRKDASNHQINQTSYTYDAHGRQYTVSDARNGTTTYTYNNNDQVAKVVTPAPGTGQGAEQTLTYYDNMGRLQETIQPDYTSVTNTYYQTGQLIQTHGSRTYPVGYGYDAQGRMTTMTNWTNFASNAGARVTTWNYDTNRGFLTNKVYDDGKGTSYGYTPAGRLQSRLWARGINTAYAYNGAGDLATVIYNDGVTVGITNGYDRLGRLNVISNGATVSSLTYDDARQVLTEAYAGGTLDGFSITNGYDGFLRRTNNVMLHTGTTLATSFSTFDAASRLFSVSDGTNSATYSYLANSPLVSQIMFKQSSTTRMTTVNQYDYLNRLTSRSSGSGLSYSYQYNNVNQRTEAVLGDGSHWNYGYDALGQVTSGKKYWSDWTPVGGEQFEYGFDDIGNRNSTKVGGDSTGAESSLRSASYTANDLNQYTSRSVPGMVDVLGLAYTTASVTVNGNSAYRKGEFYDYALPVSNGSGAVWQAVTNQAVSGTTTNTVTGNVYVPAATESYGYDADGNLTSDGRWSYTWDAENRLTQMAPLTNDPATSKKRLTFSYDYKGRRTSKQVENWITNSSTWSTVLSNKFCYDGWNLLADINGTNNTVICTYLWGTDMSGSPQGAGGVGGLLRVGASTTNCFAAFDGNGNVAGLVNASDGSTVAQYEYTPFGEVIRATGPMAKVNPFRFSTKYQDDESDLLYYGYRYYNGNSGRWLSRDPLMELGEREIREPTSSRIMDHDIPPNVRKTMNLYCLLNNVPIDDVDRLGLCNAGECGPDVTAALGHTLRNIMMTFWNADELTEWIATDNMFNLNILGSNSGTSAWDIVPIYEAGSISGYWWPNTSCGKTRGTAKCDFSVTFRGDCYSASAVNYAMWGRMNRVAGQAAALYGWYRYDASLPQISLPTAIVWADLYKLGIQHDGRATMLKEVNAFITYGYEGEFNAPPILPCAGSSCVVTDDSLPWRWRGLKDSAQ